jgi:hypothetical protein
VIGDATDRGRGGLRLAHAVGRNLDLQRLAEKDGTEAHQPRRRHPDDDDQAQDPSSGAAHPSIIDTFREVC